MNVPLDHASADSRAATNPIFNDNRFKLGLFCHNASVIQMTTAPEKYAPTWPRSLALARLADAIGLEVIVSFAGWRGAYPDDPKHCSHREYEPFTWAAAMAAVTKYPAIVGTFHAQLTSPAFVAKAATTIDHITGGRAGLNVVAGSSRLAFAQFGRSIEDHDTRYAHTEEFVARTRRNCGWTSSCTCRATERRAAARPWSARRRRSWTR